MGSPEQVLGASIEPIVRRARPPGPSPAGLLLRRWRLGRRLRRRLHAQGERFGVGHLDLVALLDDLELIGVLHVERHDVAPRPLECDRALLRIDADDVGNRGDLACAGDRRPLAGLRPRGAFGYGRLTRLDLGLPQLERERLGIARDDEIAELVVLFRLSPCTR